MAMQSAMTPVVVLMGVDHAHQQSSRWMEGWNVVSGEIYVKNATLKKSLRSVLEQSQASF